MTMSHEKIAEIRELQRSVSVTVSDFSDDELISLAIKGGMVAKVSLMVGNDEVAAICSAGANYFVEEYLRRAEAELASKS